MIDLAWSELAVIGLVAVLVLGPKELPKAMRTMAQFMRKARKLAGEFQGHFNDMVRESELDEVKNAVTKVTNTNIGSEVEKLIDPSGEFKRELDDTVTQTRAQIESAARIDPPTASPAPAPPPAPATPAGTPS
jgi:sec-independent protein translocase protein TatB